MESETTFLRSLAEHAARVSYHILPEQVIHNIRRAVLDRIGCALGAWRIGSNRKLIRVLCDMSGTPEATIWGNGCKVPAPHAALAVGTFSSHLEFDSHDGMIPAAFAVGEMQHSDGKAIIAALAAGYDVAGAVRELVASGIEAHGLHWPGQLSVYAATTAACKLLRATDDQIAGALGFAGCLSPVAPFEAFTKGASVKDFYGGWGNMLGVMAAQLCKLGFSGPDTLFEGKRGLAKAWTHGRPSTETLEAALPESRKSGASQLHFKPFPSCTSAHSALSAIEVLMSQNPDLDVDKIVRIEVGTYAFGANLSNESKADTPISAKLNIPHLCAAMLQGGGLDPKHTEEPHISDPSLQELASKISVFVLPDTSTDFLMRRRPASVTMILQDGRRLKASVNEPKWGCEKPATDADLEEKFRRLVGDLMSPSRLEELIKVIWELDYVADIGDIIAYLV